MDGKDAAEAPAAVADPNVAGVPGEVHQPVHPSGHADAEATSSDTVVVQAEQAQSNEDASSAPASTAGATQKMSRRELKPLVRFRSTRLCACDFHPAPDAALPKLMCSAIGNCQVDDKRTLKACAPTPRITLCLCSASGTADTHSTCEIGFQGSVEGLTSAKPVGHASSECYCHAARSWRRGCRGRQLTDRSRGPLAAARR